MTDHLPECIYAPRNVDPKKGIEWGGQPCICYALRACEQRVREEWYEAQSEAWEQGFQYALDAAREAVDSMVIETAGNSAATVNQALAAIDALRENND